MFYQAAFIALSAATAVVYVGALALFGYRWWKIYAVPTYDLREEDAWYYAVSRQALFGAILLAVLVLAAFNPMEATYKELANLAQICLIVMIGISWTLPRIYGVMGNWHTLA